ncbi:NUDIX hydrolase [Clostridiaceae bacterium M8S5]|nr:NUDIX hydrolase [Clostridiaceae bacterium M8S5]
MFEAVKKYIPINEQEQKDLDLFLSSIKHFEDLLTRNNIFTHIVSIGFVVNKNRSHILMVHHNIFNEWSLPGGHVDGECDFLKVAIKETREETGIIAVSSVIKDIYSIDVLPVIGHMKLDSYVSAHTHLALTYLLEADESEQLVIKSDENSDVKWIEINEVIEKYCNESHMRSFYKKLINKLDSVDV